MDKEEGKIIIERSNYLVAGLAGGITGLLIGHAYPDKGLDNVVEGVIGCVGGCLLINYVERKTNMVGDMKFNSFATGITVVSYLGERTAYRLLGRNG